MGRSREAFKKSRVENSGGNSIARFSFLPSACPLRKVMRAAVLKPQMAHSRRIADEANRAGTGIIDVTALDFTRLGAQGRICAENGG
jgi:hypothetical protein